MEFGFEPITAPERAGSMIVHVACVIHEAITQDTFRFFGWVQESRCKTRNGLGINKHRLYESKE